MKPKEANVSVEFYDCPLTKRKLARAIVDGQHAVTYRYESEYGEPGWRALTIKAVLTSLTMRSLADKVNEEWNSLLCQMIAK